MTTTTELWAPITAMPHYLVSNLARIFNTRTNRYLKPVPNGHYLKLVLSDKGRDIQMKLHVAVARAWCPNPEDKPWVNHLYPKLTQTREGNVAKALEWVTPKENRAYVAISKHFGFEDIQLEPSPEEQSYDEYHEPEPHRKEKPFISYIRNMGAWN